MTNRENLKTILKDVIDNADDALLETISVITWEFAGRQPISHKVNLDSAVKNLMNSILTCEGCEKRLAAQGITDCGAWTDSDVCSKHFVSWLNTERTEEKNEEHTDC